MDLYLCCLLLKSSATTKKVKVKPENKIKTFGDACIRPSKPDPLEEMDH